LASVDDLCQYASNIVKQCSVAEGLILCHALCEKGNLTVAIQVARSMLSKATTVQEKLDALGTLAAFCCMRTNSPYDNNSDEYKSIQESLFTAYTVASELQGPDVPDAVHFALSEVSSWLAEYYVKCERDCDKALALIENGASIADRAGVPPDNKWRAFVTEDILYEIASQINMARDVSQLKISQSTINILRDYSRKIPTNKKWPRLEIPGYNISVEDEYLQSCINNALFRLQDNATGTKR
jgi:hypothetical protein